MAIRITDVGLWAPIARATRPPGRTLPSYAGRPRGKPLREPGLALLPGEGGRPFLGEGALAARRFSAAEALQMGLVNQVVPGDALHETAYGLASAIAGNAPLTVAAVKAAIREASAPRRSETSPASTRWSRPASARRTTWSPHLRRQGVAPGRVVEGHGRDGAGHLDEQLVRARLMVQDRHAAAFPGAPQITAQARSFSISAEE